MNSEKIVFEKWKGSGGPPPENCWKLHCFWWLWLLILCSVVLTNHNVVHRLNPTHKCKLPIDNILCITENTFNSATSIVTHNQQILLTQVFRNVKAVGL